MRESLMGLLSERSSLSHPQIGEVWRQVCENCDLGVPTLLTLASTALPARRRKLRRLLGERVVRVTVKPFMDMSTMSEERLCSAVCTLAPVRHMISARRSVPSRPGRN